MRRTTNLASLLVVGSLSLIAGCSGGSGQSGSAVSGVAAKQTGGGQASDISPNPGLVLANGSEAFLFLNTRSILASSGRPGVHRTDNRGQQWAPAMQGLVDAETGMEPNASAFCQAPSARATVYDLGNAINTQVVTTRPYRTDDFGASWRPLAALAGVFLADCAVDPVSPDVLYVLGQGNGDESLTHLFKSMDGGQHFAEVGSGLEQTNAAWHVRVSPFDRNVVYVTEASSSTDPNPSAFEGLYVSTDGGLHFTRSATAPANPYALFFQPAAPGSFFLATFDGQMFRTTDGGATYTPPAGLPLTQSQYVAFDPRDPQTNYVAAGTNGLFRSTDGGLTYTRMPGPTADQLGHLGAIDVALPPATRGGDDDEGDGDGDGGSRNSIYISTSFGPLRSDDGASSFKPILRGYRGATVNDLELDASGRLMVGVFHTLQLFRGARAGQPEPYEQTGARMTPGGEAVAVAGSPTDSNALLVALFGDGVWRTADGGASWTRAIMPVLPSLNPFARMTYAPSDASRVYFVSRCCGFFRSDDGGVSFTQTQTAPPLRLGTVAVDRHDRDMVYVGSWIGQRGLLKSTNGGSTFGTALPGSESSDFAQIVIDPSDPLTLYAARRQGGVLRSTDGGANWSPAGSLPAGETLGVVLDPQSPAHVFAWVQGQGLFRSNDHGMNWIAVETDVAKRRSGAEAGRVGLVADPVFSGRVYLGNAGVVQVDTGP